MSGGERDHTPAARRLIIKGRVQGVGYRAWTVVEAQKLGLRGWVRNRRDGTVEVLAVGVTEALEALVEACRKGPAYSVVDAVDALPAEDDGSDGFRWVNTA